jgi:hypothetical protein
MIDGKFYLFNSLIDYLYFNQKSIFILFLLEKQQTHLQFYLNQNDNYIQL